MNKILQGIGLILFGIFLLVFSIIDPYILFIESISQELILMCAMASSIIGLIFIFKNTKE